MSIKVCDVTHGKKGEAAIAAILPSLLHKGLLSGAEEVRAIGSVHCSLVAFGGSLHCSLSGVYWVSTLSP